MQRPRPRFSAPKGGLVLRSTAGSVLLACVAVSAQAAEPQRTLLDWVRDTRAARLRGDHRNWLEAGLHAMALAPDHPDLLISVARARAAVGHVEDSMDTLGEAVQRGAGLDLAGVPELQRLPPSPELEAINERARKNLGAIPRAQLFAVIPDATADPEGISYDPMSRRLFVGTRHGEILQVDQRGSVSTFVPRGSGMLQVLGLKVDGGRRLLWAVSGVFPDLLSSEAQKPEVGVGGVHAFRLTDGKPVARYWLDERPVLHGFNDLALARNGDVYVTDTAQAALYRVHAGKLELFVSDEHHLTLANGIVLPPDEKRLYVASLEGISTVDLATMKVDRLTVPANAAVNSIDGLAYDRGDLIGVQGSPYLARVVRISLGKDGLSVTGVSTLSSRSPAEYQQTTAVVAGDQLYVVASAPAVDTAGSPLAKEPKPQIVRIRLR
jgi:sugar lactone lactonase YvrE